MTHLAGPLVVGVDCDGDEFSAHILTILLAPQGLRAAYTTADKPDTLDWATGDPVPFWKFNAHEILDAWLSKPEGDAEAAIRTAFDLLPSRP